MERNISAVEDEQRRESGGDERPEHSLEIAEATLADIPIIAKIGRYFHELTRYKKYLSYKEQGFAHVLSHIISSGTGKLWILWDENKVVGAACATIMPGFYNPDELTLYCIFVDVFPEYQKQGWGRKLMELCEKWGADNQAVAVTYSGYSPEFVKSLKLRGFEQTEIKLMKELK